VRRVFGTVDLDAGFGVADFVAMDVLGVDGSVVRSFVDDSLFGLYTALRVRRSTRM